MRLRVSVMVSALVIAAAAGWMGSGCGSDHGTAGTFAGNVTSVSPSQAMLQAPAHRWLAEIPSFVLPKALAQSTCPAKHVIICASNGRDAKICSDVSNGDCSFSVSLDVLADDFSNGTVEFADDTNGNGAIESGEKVATLTNPLGRVCNGSVVTLSDVAINFTNGTATASSVVKNPDTCSGATSVPVPTATPTYTAGASLHQPPSPLLAFLSGVGVVGLLLPSRRKSRR